MCGIAGVLSSDAALRDRTLVKRMTDEIAHRGPDDSGVHASGAITLGFRRLSIIDLASGHQPMVSQDQRFALLFNGEIYNFPGIRRELEQDYQRQFITHSDTEVVLQAFEVWGADSFIRFNGMFAIAIWDQIKQSLTLARDRAGKKPLFMYATPAAFLFASEVKALRVHPLFSAKPDLSRIAASAVYRYVPGQETLFANVNALPPGHWAELNVSSGFNLNPKPFWTHPACLPPAIDLQQRKPKAAVTCLHDKLAASVQRRMVADVPVGAFLSGGLDSSLIVALMAAEGVEQLNTFSVGFSTGFSEHSYARKVAQAIGTTHHETIVDAAALLHEIPSVLWHRETPVSEPSDIPLYILSREARRHVTVVLSGEGSDELFAGYPKYQAEHYLSPFPNRLLRSLLPSVQKVYRKGKGSSSSLALALAGLSDSDPHSSMARWFGAFAPEDYDMLFQPSMHPHIAEIHAMARRITSGCPSSSRLTMMQLQDFQHWLPANLLLRGDRVTMANSLELRCPFLDPELIDFAFSLPDTLKIRHGQGKWLVRQMASSLLPREIINRKKWGFKVPVNDWFRGSLKAALQQVLLSQKAASRGYFNQQEIQRLVVEHTQNGADHTKKLWYLFQLELWHRMFIDGDIKPSDELI